MEDRYYRTKTGKSPLSRRLKSRKLLIAIVVTVPVVLYLFFGSHGFLQRFRLEQQIADLEANIEAAKVENEALKAEAAALDTDLKTIERVAREKYGMSRDGETVYRTRRPDHSPDH